MRTIQVPRRFVRHSWGGTETVVLESCKQLQRAGVSTKIFTTTALGGRATEEIEGVPVRRFRYLYPYLGLGPKQRRSLDQCGGNLFSWQLWRALRREKELDLLHLHTGKRLGGIIRSEAHRRKIPYVVSLHGGLTQRPISERLRQAAPTLGTLEYGKAIGWWVGSRKVISEASAVLCLSNEERDAVLQRYPGKRVRVVAQRSRPASFRRREREAIPPQTRTGP